MFRVLGFATSFLITLSVAQAAQAFASQPIAAIGEEPRQDVRLVQTCLPRISPQKAAAFGLPLMVSNVVQGCATR